jgi:hypothetical protein
LHKGLDVVQFKDGRDKVLLNRDDLSVFRLDTVASNKAPTVCIQRKPSLTTKTDYQASYPNTLQTTSYNFTASENTGEVCAGVVKSSGIHSKNQAQHAADLELLQQKSEVKDVFINPETHNPNEIECIRVDSGGDEALYYQEVQFWWTLRHIRRPTRLQLITCRYSGGSSLNRVELQNGCEVKSRSGLFIPSTLNGSNLCKESGDVDKVKLEQNLSDAIDVYISRVSGAPCGNTQIELFRGEKCPRNQELRDNVRLFMNGNKKQKEKLKKDSPGDYELIQNVLNVRERHMQKNVPLRYVFQLLCCYKKDCFHPLCKQGRKQEQSCWYEGGPPLSFVPLPVPDKSRPHGWEDCPKCSPGKCAGHYLQPAEVITLHQAGKYNPQKVQPSESIKDFFKSKNGNGATESEIEKIAKQVMLPVEEVNCTLT